MAPVSALLCRRRRGPASPPRDVKAGRKQVWRSEIPTLLVTFLSRSQFEVCAFFCFGRIGSSGVASAVLSTLLLSTASGHLIVACRQSSASSIGRAPPRPARLADSRDGAEAMRGRSSASEAPLCGWLIIGRPERLNPRSSRSCRRPSLRRRTWPATCRPWRRPCGGSRTEPGPTAPPSPWRSR